VCRSVTIKNGCLLEEGTVIGSDVVIGAGSTSTRTYASGRTRGRAGAVVHESIIWAGSWKRGLFSSYGLNGLINVEFTPEFCIEARRRKSVRSPPKGPRSGSRATTRGQRA